jgi:hypothetical protein
LALRLADLSTRVPLLQRSAFLFFFGKHQADEGSITTHLVVIKSKAKKYLGCNTYFLLQGNSSTECSLRSGTCQPYDSLAVRNRQEIKEVIEKRMRGFEERNRLENLHALRVTEF